MTIIRVLDTETTGFNPPQAEVIEIGWCDLHRLPNGQHACITYPDHALIRPAGPIPPETSAIHHLTMEDFNQAGSLAEAIAAVSADSCRYGSLPPQAEPVAYFAAHNAKFERMFLEGHLPALPWICTWKCALVAWPDAPGHGNQVLRYWLNPEGIDRALAQPAHRAGPDAYATAFTLRELLKTYSIDQLVEISSQPALLPRVPFGKQKGARWSEVDDGFLDWILVRDFDSDVLHTARTEQERRWAERRASQTADDMADQDEEEVL